MQNLVQMYRVMTVSAEAALKSLADLLCKIVLLRAETEKAQQCVFSRRGR
jgi:hypothetical protein